MLYKWQFMFNDELEIRNLEIVVVRCGYDLTSVGYHQKERFTNGKLNAIKRLYGNYAAAPREITINARLFELLVYNLVDNAVKYAYIGTNIYLIWSRIDNEYELSVVSYGPRMPDGEEMYGLYVRGNDVRFRQGDGLGLYVVKRIQEKLELSRSHDSERISYHNIPLIPWYNKTDFFESKDYTKISDSKLFINNDTPQALLAINEYSETKIKENDLTSEYLKKNIGKETWKTSFHIRIPIRSNRKNS
jgi:signal transduction histidine kinase